MRASGTAELYVPIDVSATFLSRTAARLRREYPGLAVEPAVADISEELNLPRRMPRPALFAFLGSTIGNFYPAAAIRLLRRVRAEHPGVVVHAANSAATLRAIETGSDIIMKATNVDGIYDKDPKKHTDAVKYESITYTEAINRQLKVMDTSAFALCRENDIPILVFDMNQVGNLMKAARGEKIGTLVTSGE